MTIMEPLRGGKLVSIPSREISDLWKESNIELDTGTARFVLYGMIRQSRWFERNGALEQVKETSPQRKTRTGHFVRKKAALYSRVQDMYWKRIIAPCTGCEYCMPCPHGVNIPENLNVLNELYMFDNFAESKRAYEFLPKEARAEQLQ